MTDYLISTFRNNPKAVLRRNVAQDTLSRCASNQNKDFCILIEHLQSNMENRNFSRYTEIPRGTSWTDDRLCTRCTCAVDGSFLCQSINDKCSKSCLLRKSRPFEMVYYFPPGAQWLTPANEKCRSCTCHNGQRQCLDCNQILNIEIETKSTRSISSVGEYRLPKSMTTRAHPCVLQIKPHTYRLIYPGQQTWFENFCYFCSIENSQLILC